MKELIYFAKLKESAVIPSKNEEDGCYDVYACFEDEIMFIYPGDIKMVPTGIASAFDKNMRVQLRERGSTGSIGMARRCGEIDSGYRGEWFVALNNTGNKKIVISKRTEKTQHLPTAVIYPYGKAIAQAAVEYVPDTVVMEVTSEELMAFESKRGEGKLGSSNK